LLESFNTLKSACNVDVTSESISLESLAGHEDLFGADSLHALPLLSAAVVVILTLLPIICISPSPAPRTRQYSLVMMILTWFAGRRNRAGCGFAAR
jgi:hypothetical protein